MSTKILLYSSFNTTKYIMTCANDDDDDDDDDEQRPWETDSLIFYIIQFKGYVMKLWLFWLFSFLNSFILYHL